MGRKDRPRSVGRKGSRKQPGVSPRFTGWKKWALRVLLAVLAPVLFLGLLEGSLRLFGYGYDTSYFVKPDTGEAHVSNAKFGLQFFPPRVARTPLLTVLTRQKAPDTYRIFVFGGSAAAGVPRPAFSFARILEAMLNERYPDTRFEVINTGMGAINSHVVLPIARECAEFQPDLYIVYLGNNEVAGPYGAGTAFGGFNPSLSYIRAGIALRSARVGQLFTAAVGLFAGQGPAPQDSLEMEFYTKNQVSADDARLEHVYANFRSNLRDIFSIGRSAGADVVLCTILTNLKDCPPFASIHRSALTSTDQNRWEQFYDEGAELQGAGEYAAALDRYERAGALDDQFAELHFRIGRCHLALGRLSDARKDFVLAQNLDTLRFRADSTINRIIRETANGRNEQGIHLFDLEDTIGSSSPAPFGSELFYDHVHFRFDGNYQLAAGVFRSLSLLLPASIAGSRPTEPPSLEACKKLVTLTDFDRWTMATSIVSTMSNPPFAPGRADPIEAEARRIQARLTPAATSEMLAQYRSALARRPTDLMARNSFMQLLMLRGDTSAAMTECRTILRTVPDQPKFRYGLALLLGELGKPKEAIPVLRDLSGDWLEGERFVRRTLAQALLQTGEVDEAIQEYEKTIVIMPNDAGILAELGQALLGAGRTDRALDAFRKAVELQPDSAPFHFSLAKLLHKMKRFDEARSHYSRAVELDPSFRGRSPQ